MYIVNTEVNNDGHFVNNWYGWWKLCQYSIPTWGLHQPIRDRYNHLPASF